ncbi:hypothetical protein BC827DRAFT_1157490 [Russula dissimulans]|nr:hypothetical protein BC827DRAFT_1157490 [Russula dissimulans]
MTVIFSSTPSLPAAHSFPPRHFQGERISVGWVAHGNFGVLLHEGKPPPRHGSPGQRPKASPRPQSPPPFHLHLLHRRNQPQIRPREQPMQLTQQDGPTGAPSLEFSTALLGDSG